ncbi:MAG: glutamine--fructose-6-phosphate transaminase (isomerizing) [Hyphomonadaceae bacterium]
MCGIIGILGEETAAPRLLEALARLEYRGYDSAGIATLEAGILARRRAAGKLENLREVVSADPLSGQVGIGHTRWATHGEPTVANAHPHLAGSVMVVHNGIIENFRKLREELAGTGFACTTETDSETIAQLIASNMAAGARPKQAVQQALTRLEGAFAIAVMFEGEEDLLIGARKGSPLVVGVGEGEMFLGSDALAVGPFTNRVVYLEEGDWCVLTRASYEVFDADGNAASRPETIVTAAAGMVDKGNYRHFMQKEIYEQPEAIARTIGHYVSGLDQTVDLGDTGSVDLAQVKGIQMVACGTSYYACMVAEYWFEQIAGIPVKIDIASEFRYREPKLLPGGLAIFVSQSGETADTLAALRYCKDAGLHTAGIVNVTSSTIAREVDFVLPILAGPEIGVASTKAFTAMLCALAATVLAIGKAQGALSREAELEMVAALEAVPRLVADALKLDDQFASLARDLVKARDVLYLGRGVHYPIAMEGALKLKEISYIHAEGYASGELKHGPIALIDEETPIVFVAPFDRLFDKSLSNLQEVVARRGRVVLLSDAKGISEAGDAPAFTVEVPECPDFIAPLIYSVPVQLLAYHIAVEKGTDVDQPRNLAKSVTVE